MPSVEINFPHVSFNSSCPWDHICSSKPIHNQNTHIVLLWLFMIFIILACRVSLKHFLLMNWFALKHLV